MYLEIIDYVTKSIELWSSIMFWNFYNDFLKNVFTFLVNWICRRLNNNSISGSLDLQSIDLSCTYEVDLTGNYITNVWYNDSIVFSNVSVKYVSLKPSLAPFIGIEFKGVM
jgi:hypothetical protein